MARNSSRIGRYDLIHSLATGGMGRIYLARATGIGGFERKVVIKTLEVPLTAESDPAIAMFLDEARLLALLHHQHIAAVFEVGRDDDGRCFMVLEYVEGVSAHAVWERAIQFGAALPLDFVLTVVSAAANGLHYTHTRKDADGAPLGIVHRDVTPSNVMIGYDGAVKLIDFGIAIAADRRTKTQTGFVKGKVGYLSPEQVAGHDVDPRTDVFALGILLYELTTLQRAFRDGSDLATMQRIKQGKVVRPSQVAGNYPPELEAIVMKALQVDPGDRFVDADAMRRAIEALGHRLHCVLGDAAVIEVMQQLFEPPVSQVSSGKQRAPSRQLDAAFEWQNPDDHRTLRRDSDDLVEAMRAKNGRLARASGGPPLPKPRKLRAATEAADALLGADPATRIPPRPAVAAAGASALPLASAPPLTSPPPRPGVLTTPPGTRPPDAPRPERVIESWPIGASLVEARGKRKLPLPWIAAIAVAGVLAGVGYIATQKSPDAVAGGAAPVVTQPRTAERPAMTLPTTAQPVTPPIIARPTPTTATTEPATTEPATAEPATPPAEAAPSTVRVRITSRPADATVMLDGKRLGRTPLDKTVAADPGKHVIKLRRRGYATHRLDVTLDADISERVRLTRDN